MVDRGQQGGVSRRLLLGGSAALAGAGLAGLGGEAAEADAAASGASRRSVRRAVGFLQQVVDAYHTTGPRFVQSYYDGSGLGDLGFVYDNALTLIALLAGGDVTRARAIGDAYLSAQANDAELTDGRLRQTYHADDLIDPKTKKIALSGIGLDYTAVGDMAWSGLALAHLAHRTKRADYLEAAVKIGTWIRTQRSTTGLGGYEFGTTPGLKGFKSTEHNVDVYGLFTILAKLTGDKSWRSDADYAWAFVRRQWNSADGYFWTGSNDGSTINKSATQRPLDVQTWSWLAARERRYAVALDWASTNLATTDTPQRTNSELKGNYSVSGVGFGSGTLMADVTKPIDDYHGTPDSGAVWFEGTGQLALALSNRGARGDRAAANRLLAQIESTQDRLGADQTFNKKPVDGGIVAASSPLNTGYGFGYYQHLHVAATSWYVFAATGTNPYRL